MPGNQAGEKWYYDACALDNDKRTYGEIFNGGKRYKRVALAGNLSIGEAYGSSYRKKGREAADAFLGLLHQLNNITTKDFEVFKVIDHKGIDALYLDIKVEFPALGMTDSIHLATAIINKCSILRTADAGLYNLPKDKIKKIADKYSIPSFAITKMD
ncbi:hypothetical protein KGO95_01805 [Patescibacteria group bacterium]|nr:hypothetical protein [Patescibacteria group bacterium]